MATHQNYDNETPGSRVALEFSDRIKGKVVVITGISPNSIGETLALNIARSKPSRLILASRTPSKLQTVTSSIKSEIPDASIDTVILDLASQPSIHSAADMIFQFVDRIDILINNAAVVDSELKHTNEGIEAQFGVGHIGHFLFTNLLLPLLSISASLSEEGTTRIINVSSKGHRLSPVRFHDWNFEGKEVPPEEQPEQLKLEEGAHYSPWIAYGQVKSANVLFSVALNQRLQKQGIRSYAVHPGSIQTSLSRSLNTRDSNFIEKVVNGAWQTHDQGTATILIAALDPALDEPQKSVYLSGCQVVDAAGHATDEGNAEKLWGLSESLTGLSGGQVRAAI